MRATPSLAMLALLALGACDSASGDGCWAGTMHCTPERAAATTAGLVLAAPVLLLGSLDSRSEGPRPRAWPEGIDRATEQRVEDGRGESLYRAQAPAPLRTARFACQAGPVWYSHEGRVVGCRLAEPVVINTVPVPAGVLVECERQGFCRYTVETGTARFFALELAPGWTIAFNREGHLMWLEPGGHLTGVAPRGAEAERLAATGLTVGRWRLREPEPSDGGVAGTMRGDRRFREGQRVAVSLQGEMRQGAIR